MTDENKTNVRVGPGVLGLLTITFVVLKALGYISWSWWLVFLPLWGPLALVAVIFAVFLIGMGLFLLFAGIREELSDRKYRKRPRY